MADKKEEIPVNYTKEAFLHPVNLVTLLVATIGGFIAGNVGVPSELAFSVICAIELMYLGIVPRLPRFQKGIKLKKIQQQDTRGQEKELFKSLGEKSRRKYLVLRHLVQLVEKNFEKIGYSSQGLLENIQTKMDELLSNYLNLLDMYKRYEVYTNTAIEERLQREVQEEEQEIRALDSEQLKKNKTRRLRILKKRAKKFEIAKENYLICETQLETIEDAIRYIYEQSMTMTNPEEIGFQLDNLLEEMEETSSIINDLDTGSFSMQENVDEVVLDAELREAQSAMHTPSSKRTRN